MTGKKKATKATPKPKAVKKEVKEKNDQQPPPDTLYKPPPRKVAKILKMEFAKIAKMPALQTTTKTVRELKQEQEKVRISDIEEWQSFFSSEPIEVFRRQSAFFYEYEDKPRRQKPPVLAQTIPQMMVEHAKNSVFPKEELTKKVGERIPRVKLSREERKKFVKDCKKLDDFMVAKNIKKPGNLQKRIGLLKKISWTLKRIPGKYVRQKYKTDEDLFGLHRFFRLSLRRRVDSIAKENFAKYERMADYQYDFDYTKRPGYDLRQQLHAKFMEQKKKRAEAKIRESLAKYKVPKKKTKLNNNDIKKTPVIDDPNIPGPAPKAKPFNFFEEPENLHNAVRKNEMKKKEENRHNKKESQMSKGLEGKKKDVDMRKSVEKEASSSKRKHEEQTQKLRTDALASMGRIPKKKKEDVDMRTSVDREDHELKKKKEEQKSKESHVPSQLDKEESKKKLEERKKQKEEEMKRRDAARMIEERKKVEELNKRKERIEQEKKKEDEWKRKKQAEYAEAKRRKEDEERQRREDHERMIREDLERLRQEEIKEERERRERAMEQQRIIEKEQFERQQIQAEQERVRREERNEQVKLQMQKDLEEKRKLVESGCKSVNIKTEPVDDYTNHASTSTAYPPVQPLPSSASVIAALFDPTENRPARIQTTSRITRTSALTITPAPTHFAPERRWILVQVQKPDTSDRRQRILDFIAKNTKTDGGIVLNVADDEPIFIEQMKSVKETEAIKQEKAYFKLKKKLSKLMGMKVNEWNKGRKSKVRSGADDMEYSEYRLEWLEKKIRWPFGKADGLYWPIVMLPAKLTERNLVDPLSHIYNLLPCQSTSGTRLSIWMLTAPRSVLEAGKTFTKAYEDSGEDDRYDWREYSAKPGRFSNRKPYKAKDFDQDQDDARRANQETCQNEKRQDDEYYENSRRYRNNRDDSGYKEHQLKVLSDYVKQSRIDRFSSEATTEEKRRMKHHPGMRTNWIPLSWCDGYDNLMVELRDNALGKILNSLNSEYERYLPQGQGGYSYEQAIDEWCYLPMYASLIHQTNSGNMHCFSQSDLAKLQERQARYNELLAKSKGHNFTLEEIEKICEVTDIDKRFWTLIYDQLVSNFKDMPTVAQLMWNKGKTGPLLPYVENAFDRVMKQKQPGGR